MTPGIIAFQHAVPLTVRSSQHFQELLAKGTLVSIRSPNGKVKDRFAELHIRLFKEGDRLGWEDVQRISRTELSHLRGILFREPGYEGEMGRIRAEFRDKNLPSAPALGPAVDVNPNGEIGRVPPPNSPDGVIKIGPPTSRRSGRKEKATDVVKPYGPRPLKALEQRGVKEEKAEDSPFLSTGILSPPPAMSGAGTTSQLPATIGEIQNESTSLPPLEYPSETDLEILRVSANKPATIIPFDNSIKSYKLTRIASDVSSEMSVAGGHARAYEEVVEEIVGVLKKLRVELGRALDLETKKMLDEIEGKARTVMDVKGKGGDDRKDDDGDVVMGGSEKTTGSSPAPAYRPASPRTGLDNRNPFIAQGPATYSTEEMEKVIKRMVEEVSSLQWKTLDEENQMDTRMEVVEARVAVLEMQREGEEGWSVTRNPRRRPERPSGERFALRGRTSRLESIAQEVSRLRLRVGEAEKSLKEGDIGVKRKVNSLEATVAGLEGKALALDRKIEGAEAKWEEGRLRQELTNREVATGKNIVQAGLLPRVTRLEARLLAVEFRLSTAEEQTIWTDQKLRAVRMTVIAPNPAEHRVRAATVSTVWTAAAEAFNRRIDITPRTSDPRDAQATSTSTVRSNNPFETTSRPAVTF